MESYHWSKNYFLYKQLKYFCCPQTKAAQESDWSQSKSRVVIGPESQITNNQAFPNSTVIAVLLLKTNKRAEKWNLCQQAADNAAAHQCNLQSHTRSNLIGLYLPGGQLSTKMQRSDSFKVWSSSCRCRSTSLQVAIAERFSLHLAVTLERCGKEKRTNKYIFQKLPLKSIWTICQVRKWRSKKNPLFLKTGLRTQVQLAYQMTLTSPSPWPPHSWTPWTPPPRPPSPSPPWTSWHSGLPTVASLLNHPAYQGEGPWLGPRLAWAFWYFSWYQLQFLTM